MTKKPKLHIEIRKAQSAEGYTVMLQKQAQLLASENNTYWIPIHNALKDIDPKTVTDQKLRTLPGTYDRRMHCDVCEQSVEIVADLGPEPDYDQNKIAACLNCLQKAIKMLEDQQ